MSNKVRDALSDKAIIKESLFLGDQTQGLVCTSQVLFPLATILYFLRQSLCSSGCFWPPYTAGPTSSSNLLPQQNLLLRSLVTRHTWLGKSLSDEQNLFIRCCWSSSSDPWNKDGSSKNSQIGCTTSTKPYSECAPRLKAVQLQEVRQRGRSQIL